MCLVIASGASQARHLYQFAFQTRPSVCFSCWLCARFQKGQLGKKSKTTARRIFFIPLERSIFKLWGKYLSGKCCLLGGRNKIIWNYSKLEKYRHLAGYGIPQELWNSFFPEQTCCVWGYYCGIHEVRGRDFGKSACTFKWVILRDREEISGGNLLKFLCLSCDKQPSPQSCVTDLSRKLS